MKPKLLLIGALPPPQHGVSIANEMLLNAPALCERFAVHHLDLADRRPMSTVERFDWRNIWLALCHAAQCWWCLLSWWPDVVYVPISQKALGFLRDSMFLVPARLLGRRVVVHLHGGNFDEFHRASSRGLRWLIRFALGQVARGIVLGESLRPALATLVPADRLAVVPNGVPDFAAGAPPTPANARLRVLYLGTVRSEKGIDVFVAAALQALARGAAVEFVVAGPWYWETERKTIPEQVRAASREREIRFVGEVSGTEKTRTLLEADVLVFPGVQQEGMPLVVLEAMCAGLAVITTDRGCLREVVVEGETGFIVTPSDAGAIAVKVMALAQDRMLCARLGQAGRRRYEQFYRQDRYVQRMLDVLDVARAGQMNRK